MERKTFGMRLALSFLIATFIFFSGFLISYLVSSYQCKAISESQERLRYNLLEIEIQRDLGDCNNFNPYIFSGELDYVGSVTEALETRFGKLDPKVVEQKKVYSLIQAQHFLFVRENVEKCKIDLDVILFFYSNEWPYADSAEKIGLMLYSLKNRREVMVYSFDLDLDSSTIEILRDKYNISQPNTLIINENIKIESPENVEEIEGYL